VLDIFEKETVKSDGSLSSNMAGRVDERSLAQESMDKIALKNTWKANLQ